MMQTTKLVLLCLLCAGSASASGWNVTGDGGQLWDGNVSYNDMSEIQATGNVELKDLVDDWVSYWRFDEESGTTMHDENESSDGTWNGNATASWTTGVYGGALEFDGSDDYVACGSPIVSKTIVVLVKYVSSGWAKGIVANGGATNFHALTTGEGENYGTVPGGNANDGVYTTNTYIDSSWHTVTAIRDNNYVYVDGVNMSTTSDGNNYGVDNALQIGRRGAGKNANVIIDYVRIYDRVLSQTEINQTRDNEHNTTGNLTRTTFDSGSGNKNSKVRIHGNNPVAGANITVAINKSTDQSSWVWEELGTVTTIGDFNVTYNVANDYRYAKWDFYAQTNNSSQTSVIYNGSLYYEAVGAAAGPPSVTYYAPTDNIWPEVQDSQLFNVTANQSTQCRWYVNGTLKQTNSTPSLTHAYTNTSLLGGVCNVTAVANNTNGTDTKTWEFEVGADSISYTILSEDDTNLTCLIRWNVTRIGSNVTHWNTSYSNTTNGYKYCKNFDNDTEILHQTATSDDETLWFNSSTLLPTGIYYINGFTQSTNEVTVYTNEWTLLNIWEIPQTFQQIAANVSNVTNCVYYNSTSGLFEEYRAGYTYNHDVMIPANCSIFVHIDDSATMPVLPGEGETGNTTESITPTTGGITIVSGGWFYGYLPGSVSKTLSEIETEMDSDSLDVWHLRGWNNATQEYTSTGSYSVAPNEGYAVHVNNTGEYTP